MQFSTVHYCYVFFRIFLHVDSLLNAMARNGPLENGMKYSSLSESESTGRSMDACHLLTVVTHRNGSTCTDLGEGGIPAKSFLYIIKSLY